MKNKAKIRRSRLCGASADFENGSGVGGLLSGLRRSFAGVFPYKMLLILSSKVLWRVEKR